MAALSPTRKIQARKFCTAGMPSCGAPAAQEHFLGDVLGVVRVSQHEPERADQLVAEGVEGAQQHLARRGVRRDIGCRTGTHSRGRSGHTVTLTDEGFGAPDCRRVKNARKGRGRVPSRGARSPPRYQDAARVTGERDGDKEICRQVSGDNSISIVVQQRDRLRLRPSPLSFRRIRRYDAAMDAATSPPRLRVGMAGLGMIFDETYHPVFEQLHADALLPPRLRPRRGRAGRRRQPHRQPSRALPPVPGRFGPLPQLHRAGRHRPDARAGRGRRLHRHAGRPPLRRRPAGPRRRQTRPDREALRPAVAGTGRAGRPGPQERRPRQGRLPQAGRPRSQEAAHPRPRRRSAARQQRLLLLTGAEIDQRQTVRRVDRRTQPGDLRRRPLSQID